MITRFNTPVGRAARSCRATTSTASTSRRMLKPVLAETRTTGMKSQNGRARRRAAHYCASGTRPARSHLLTIRTQPFRHSRIRAAMVLSCAVGLRRVQHQPGDVGASADALLGPRHAGAVDRARDFPAPHPAVSIRR